MGNFAICLKQVLAYEGGNADNPKDPGGRTSRGITQRVYDNYCDKHTIARADVWKASDATIASIYRENYWNRIDGDKLPDGIDLCIFDAAVNSGLGQAAKWVQRSLQLRPDGDFGPATIECVKTCIDQIELIKAICSRRLAMLQALPTWRTFGKGWQARVANVQKHSIALAAAIPHVAPLEPEKPTPKAKVEDLHLPPVDHSAANATVAVGSVGTLLASGATWLKNAAADTISQLQPLAETYPKVASVCAILTIVGVIAGLYITLIHNKYHAVVNGEATANVGD